VIYFVEQRVASDWWSSVVCTDDRLMGCCVEEWVLSKVFGREVLGCVVMSGVWLTDSVGFWVVVAVLGAGCFLLWIVFCVAGAWLG